jgi:hypothetical protein
MEDNMPKSIMRAMLMTSLIGVFGTTISLPQSAAAQLGQPVDITDTLPAAKTRRIIRNIKPVDYWVDAEKLRVRDNPVAGDMVGMLELGQKVKAYETLENWARISKRGETEKWVNTAFLINQQVTWASYNSQNRSRRSGLSGSKIAGDVDLTRIKVPGDKSGKLYAASLKELPSGQRLVVTWQRYKTGPHYSKLLIACDSGAPFKVQIIGEGASYRMMEADPRGQDVDVSKAVPELAINSDNVSDKTRKVAEYSCKS